ncbi:MAG: DUF542 domain-containing protein [Planctomycetaceae bacterium]|nr:DUF542 domain-containing protein [Planctomycetaceae bacterium]
MNCGPEDTIPDWLIEHPETIAVFTAMGIDYSCGGKSLEYACLQSGQDVAVVLAELRRVIEGSQDCWDESHRKSNGG